MYIYTYVWRYIKRQRRNTHVSHKPRHNGLSVTSQSILLSAHCLLAFGVLFILLSAHCLLAFGCCNLSILLSTHCLVSIEGWISPNITIYLLASLNPCTFYSHLFYWTHAFYLHRRGVVTISFSTFPNQSAWGFGYKPCFLHSHLVDEFVIFKKKTSFIM